MKLHLFNFFSSINLSPDVYCPKCSNKLHRISDGLLGTAWICEKCHNVYQLHLMKVPDRELSDDYMKYALGEILKLEQ